MKEGNRKTRTMVKESLCDDNEMRRINFGKCIIKVREQCSWFVETFLQDGGRIDLRQGGGGGGGGVVGDVMGS